MKKNGFTLVELLAVIAILAILVIISLPNVMGMFNEAKRNSFTTELKQIYKVAQQKWVSDSMFNTDEQTYSRSSNAVCSKQLDLTGRSELEYLIKLDKSGSVVEFYATDGSYQYAYRGPGLLIENINDVTQISDIVDGRYLNITCNTAKIERPAPENPGDYLMNGNAYSNTNLYLRTNIAKKNIEKVTFSSSTSGHSLDDGNCFDVSNGFNGSVIAWTSDSDSNGLYEITIGADGGVFISNGAYLFYELINVTTIDGLDNLNTSQMRNAHMLFYKCYKLVSLDVSKIDTSNCTDIAYMFYECNSLTEIDLSHFNTDKVTDMSYIFHGCKKVERLDLSSFNTSNVSSTEGMFANCMELVYLNISNLDTSNSRNMRFMFANCNKITSLDLSHFNTSRVTNMECMFEGCRNLISINLSGWDTSKVTDMSSMFRYTALESKALTLNLSNFNTSKVRDMASMFSNSGIVEITGLNNFNTSNVTNMASMFSSNYLYSIDLSSFNTSKVTDMSFMFDYSHNLTTLNLSNFNTSLVTNMNNMFKDCKKVSDLNIESFNTSNVIYMNNMFQNCELLTDLYIPNFSATNVQYTKNMFSGCKKLVSIFTSQDLDFSNVSSSNSASMFYNCVKLKGGSDTAYNSSKTNSLYAHIDGGSSNPGYFSLKTNF